MQDNLNSYSRNKNFHLRGSSYAYRLRFLARVSQENLRRRLPLAEVGDSHLKRTAMLCLAYACQSRVLVSLKAQNKIPLILMVSVSFRVRRKERINAVTLVHPCCLFCMGYWPSVRSRWLDIGQVLFCVFIWTETKSRSIKKERGQYPAILTEQTWSIKDLLSGFRGNFP